MSDEPKPCVAPYCPPVEEVTFSATIIQCPHCGRSPYSIPSMWEIHDRYDWICPEHELVFVATRNADGKVELGEP